MFKKIILPIALVGAFSSAAYAGDNGWTGEASLSGSKSTGNTETTDAGLGIKLEKQADKWRHKFNASADYGKAEDASGVSKKTKSRFALGYQLDRDLSDRLYAYGQGDYYQDEFGAYKDGYFLGAGLGYKVILPDPASWNLEAGSGYRSQKVRLAAGTPGGAASERQNDVGLRAFSDFDYTLNDHVSFYNDSEIIWSSSDTHLWNEIGLDAKLMGNLSARASFRLDHHTDVPAGLEKTDTITRIGIVYSIN